MHETTTTFRRIPGVLLSAAALLVPAAGCAPETEPEPTRLEIFSGDRQSGKPGHPLAGTLVVQVLSSKRIDVFGRKQERPPVAGVPVRFEVDGINDFLTEAQQKADDEAEAAGQAIPETREALKPYPFIYDFAAGSDPPDAQRPLRATTVITDGDGTARVRVRLGTLTGDWRIEASIRDKKDKVHFRVTCGVDAPGMRTEAPVEEDVPLELTLWQWDEDKQEPTPLPDREIIFSLIAEPRGSEGTADLKGQGKGKRTERTDPDGFRETSITLGDLPGIYRVIAEIETNSEDERPWRGVVFTLVAMDWWRITVEALTSLVLFVIGVRLIGRGTLVLTSRFSNLTTSAQSRGRCRGYVRGMAAGAVFQSSSQVTSYLASLANGGILRASGALGLVLGANLGGTVLCQILALRVEVLATPLLFAGTLLFLARRHTRVASLAWVFVGAGLLLVSWTMLHQAGDTASLSDELKEIPFFASATPDGPFLRYFGAFCSYLGVAAFAGFLLRTSNLIVVLAMVFVAHGMLPPSASVPLIVGANLGAAAMVFALSLRKRHEARRVALLNLLFQCSTSALVAISALVVIDGQPAFLLLVEEIVPGRLLTAVPGAAEQHVAVAHTLHNLAGGLLFLLVPAALSRPLERLLPEKTAGDDVKPYHLDDNLIDVPALALSQTTQETIYLTEVCRKAVAEAFDGFRYDDLDLADQVVRRGQVVADMHREISRYLVEVGENQLAHRDAARLEILQSAAESIARIGTFAEDFRELAARKVDEKIQPSEEIERDLGEVYDLVVAQFDNILSLLRDRDVRTEESAVKMVERLAKYSSRIEAHWRQRTETAETETLPVAAHLQTVLHQEAFEILFRIAAELAHIAQRMRILAPHEF